MTARRMFAINARQLLDDRKRGVVPTEPVSVVLTGQTERAPAVYVREDMPADRLDWRMLVNLPVWLWAAPEVPLQRVLRVVRSIADVRPKRLTLRFEAAGAVHDVDVGHGMHQAANAPLRAIHEFTWTPMDLTHTPVGAKLRRALLAELPMWSSL